METLRPRAAEGSREDGKTKTGAEVALKKTSLHTLVCNKISQIHMPW